MSMGVHGGHFEDRGRTVKTIFESNRQTWGPPNEPTRMGVAGSADLGGAADAGLGGAARLRYWAMVNRSAARCSLFPLRQVSLSYSKKNLRRSSID